MTCDFTEDKAQKNNMLLKSNLKANFCTGTYLNLAKIKALNRCAKRKNGCKILQSLKINKVLGYKALEKSKREGKIKSMSGCDTNEDKGWFFKIIPSS